MKQRCTGSIPT